jgi:fatty-acyl-CoA synthase
VVVPREQSMARLAKLSAGTLQHTPTQGYTVADRFEERAAVDPDRPFVLFEDRWTSLGALNVEANRLAHFAREAGLRAGDVVALLMENRPGFLSTWLGLAKLGATAALVNTNVRGAALARAIESSGARHLIAGSECLESLGEAAAPARVWVAPDPAAGAAPPPRGALDLGRELARQPTDDPDPSVRADLVAGDDLFHVFTSGTTGLPKAARLSHMRYLGVGDGMSAVAGYGPDDVIYCVLPLYHGAGGMVVTSCAVSSGAVIVLRRKLSVSRFWESGRCAATC